MKILYSSAEVHDAIKDVLADPQPDDRRVALVAFVGGQAQAFLPNPEGLEVVCCLQSGSTDALTLNRLRKRNAKIYKSERLHMKVYWSSRRGCVICSANASGSALGGGNQKEAGAWFSPNVVDIDRLWDYTKPKLIEKGDLKRLARDAEKPGKRNANGSEEMPPDFLEWLTLSGRRDWKLGWWSEEATEFAEDAVEKAKQSYGVEEPNDFICVKQGQVQARNWLLKFRIPGETFIRWSYVDFVIKVRPSDKGAFYKGYPFQAVQANPPRLYPRPPFKIGKAFCSAFKKAIKTYGEEEIESLESLKPPKPLLNLIANNMRTVT
jgi:hypothetical protein